jgi:tRNA(Leu) C34 or U34 (ribose-2'-O)-methylase TrmL
MALTIYTYRDSFFVNDGPGDAMAWRMLVDAFNVDKFYFLDTAPVEVNLSNLVIFDENGTIDLNDFVHPADASYLFGSTGMRDIYVDYPANTPVVKISVPNLVQNQGMYGCQAAAIVLYDRERKTWQ